MHLIPQEDIDRAREIDLLTYLTYYEPDNLRHISGNTYCTVEHDSLIISNGKWCWFSRGIGGKNALKYLIQVKGLPFRDAVEKLIGNISEPLQSPKPMPNKSPPKELVFPEVNSNTTRVTQYLQKRGIDLEIICWCIEHKLIYETTKYGNVIFMGYDNKGKPKHGSVRSTIGSYKGDLKGSDKRFTFKLVKAAHPKKVHVFEAVPDLLSYATIVKLTGGNWRKESYLSLAGIGGTALPKALEQFLKDYPEISHIYLHLDNDEAGRNATKNIREKLKDNYVVRDQPPPSGKDFNEYLLSHRNQFKKKEVIKR